MEALGNFLGSDVELAAAAGEDSFNRTRRLQGFAKITVDVNVAMIQLRPIARFCVRGGAPGWVTFQILNF
ncbi:hypothetical protein [Novosphingopyxis sp.]|uniref:hypothetical protein n=1 Tax=Novosphingopyxis sp. TaxID=2709690 RepID=UPI003B5A28DA